MKKNRCYYCGKIDEWMYDFVGRTCCYRCKYMGIYYKRMKLLELRLEEILLKRNGRG